MSRDVVTQADQELIASLPDNHGVTPRKLERWRQAGLVPSPVVSRGGVRGTVSRYPDGTTAQVVELVAILRNDRRLDHALLRLFMRKRWVDEAKLRGAYLEFYAKFVPRPHEDSLDAAQRIIGNGPPASSRDGFVRTIRSRLRTRATRMLPVDALVRSVLTQMLSTFLSGQFVDDGDDSAAAEIAAAMGAERMGREPIGNCGPLLPPLTSEEVADMAAAITLERVLLAAEQATMLDFKRARDQWAHVLGLLSDLGEVAKGKRRKRDYAGLALIRKMAGDEVLSATFTPAWIAVLQVLVERGVALEPLWDPTTPEGRENAELHHLLARLARSTRAPVTNDNVAEVLANAPDGLRAEFAAWLDRSSERTVIL